MVTRKHKARTLDKPVAVEMQKTAAAGFTIVDLEASAGGLEAFEQFFRHRIRPVCALEAASHCRTP